MTVYLILKRPWFVKRTLTNKSLKNSVENNFILFLLGKKSSLEVKCRICQVVKLRKGALKVLELKPLLLQEDMKRHLEQSHKNKHKYEFVLYI